MNFTDPDDIFDPFMGLHEGTANLVPTNSGDEAQWQLYLSNLADPTGPSPHSPGLSCAPSNPAISPSLTLLQRPFFAPSRATPLVNPENDYASPSPGPSSIYTALSDLPHPSTFDLGLTGTIAPSQVLSEPYTRSGSPTHHPAPSSIPRRGLVGWEGESHIHPELSAQSKNPLYGSQKKRQRSPSCNEPPGDTLASSSKLASDVSSRPKTKRQRGSALVSELNIDTDEEFLGSDDIEEDDDNDDDDPESDDYLPSRSVSPVVNDLRSQSRSPAIFTSDLLLQSATTTTAGASTSTSTSRSRRNKRSKGKAKGSAALALTIITQMGAAKRRSESEHREREREMSMYTATSEDTRDPSASAVGDHESEEGGSSSTAQPGKTQKKKKKNHSIPLPVPIPNLNKKSRGRKVPFVADLHRSSIFLDDDDKEAGPSRTSRSRRKKTATPSVSPSIQDQDQDQDEPGPSSSKRTYICAVPGCGKCFVRGEHLKRHVRSIHTHDKPHQCPYEGCDKSFSRRDNLGQHVRLHLAEHS